jgi:hypothetical protein
MMKSSGSIAAALVAAVLMVGLGGCEKAGPLERAGKQVDKTVEKAGDKIEDATRRK